MDAIPPYIETFHLSFQVVVPIGLTFARDRPLLVLRVKPFLVFVIVVAFPFSVTSRLTLVSDLIIPKSAPVFTVKPALIATQPPVSWDFSLFVSVEKLAVSPRKR